ncbi:MFS transporter [Dichotomicrobium thermohalophilum]|nr:MFS transporter [Dichotomicrobium thermohalophilum]
MYTSLLRDERGPLAFGAACTFLSAPGQTFFISLFIGALSDSLGFTAGDLGSLYLGATLGSAALLPYFGHWIDRIDLRRYAASVMIGLAVSCAVMASAAGPVSLFIAFLMLRLSGQGLMSHTGMTSVGRYFVSRRGRALSLVVMGFPLSEAVMPALAVILIGAIGWRATYLAVGAGVLLIALPLLLWLIAGRQAFTQPTAREEGARRPSAWDGARIVGRTAYFWLVLPLLIYMPLTATALIFYIQPIGEAKGWSPTLIASAFTSYALFHALAILLGGGLVDRFTARNVLAATGLPMVTGIVLLGLIDAPLTAFAFMGLMGASTGLAHTVISAMWAEVYGVERLGTIRSFSVMLVVAGTAVGPALVGPMIDAGWPIALIAGLFAVFGTVATVLALAGRFRARLPA